MSYPGGKNGSGVYQQIINRIPPHSTYIEAFLGSGAIMRMKRPADRNIGIDIDDRVIKNFSQGAPPGVTIIETNAITWLNMKILPHDTFVYCDPPYLLSTRSKGERIYRHELNEHDHIVLCRALNHLPCMVMLSGYPNKLYDDMLSSWWTATFQTTNRGGSHVTEKLWMNYPPPVFLHDYRYLGSNFRERERIKRQRQRWIARLERMPELERQSLAAAIAAVIGTGSPRQFDRSAPECIAENCAYGSAPTGKQPATEKVKGSKPLERREGIPMDSP